MLTMLVLGAIWCALHEPERRCRWLAAASVAYGLALGARPSLLFGAVILLVPVIQAWRERRQVWAALFAATGPIILIGLGLMLYNSLRFDSPFEFGVRYQLAACRIAPGRFYSLHYLWFNFRVYFLEPMRWTARFPFVHEIAQPPLPPGYAGVENPFGILTNVPLVWLTLAAPLAWRSQSGQAASTLRWFVTAVALLFGMCAVTLGLFWGANFRYEVEFLPALLLLAVVGILGLERALADRPVQRWAVRWGWGLLLGFSVAFNLLASVDQHAKVHNSMGMALGQVGRVQEAITEYDQALRIEPDYADAHSNLGTALTQVGRVQEAKEHLEASLRLVPNNPTMYYNMGIALAQLGRLQEAIEQYEQALRIKPDYAEAHDNLGVALQQAGKPTEAIAHWEQALRIKPDSAGTHNNLAVTLARLGRLQEALGHWEQALRLAPDYAEAHYNLGIALAHAGESEQAMEHWRQALRIKPDYAEAHYNLGVALQQAGKPTEAIQHFEQALRINPEFTAARNALARLHPSQ
jgi:tetratricopeptide (TPR) repeat protein